MAERRIKISWEVLRGLCVAGARMIGPDGEFVARCITGLSTESAVVAVAVGTDKTVTLTLDDPHYTGSPAYTHAAWTSDPGPEPVKEAL